MALRPARLAPGIALSAVVFSAALLWGLAGSPLSGRPGESSPARRPAPPPHVEAKAAVLIDADTGRILYSKKAHERLPPGELAKILAALVALEEDSPDREARIGRGSASAFGWGMTVAEGDLVPLGDLIALMLYRPGPAAAFAVAEHVAGSIEAFSRRMDAAARRIGAGSSSFQDPSGAGGESRSTAYDLALIALEALRRPEIAKLVARTRAVLAWRGRGVINVNSFLLSEPGAAGIKTSFTPESGHSLALAVEREGRRLLLVTLGSPTAEARRADARSLIAYGIAHFEGLSASPAVERTAYRVQEGDTLAGLAERFGVPLSAIRLANDITDPDALRAGEVLWIPR